MILSVFTNCPTYSFAVFYFAFFALSALVAPSGECLRGEGLVWFIGAVMCSLPAYRGSCSLARAMDGRILRCNTTGFCRSTTASNDCRARLVRFPCKTRYVKIPGFSFSIPPSSHKHLLKVREADIDDDNLSFSRPAGKEGYWG